MINRCELTEKERTELQVIALQRRKELLEKEIEEIKLKQKGLKNGKKSLKQLHNYFKD